jgi:hypothetical protein
MEVNTIDSSGSHSYLAGVGRVDLQIAVGSAVAVVPRLGMTVFPSLLDDSGSAPRMLVARPEIAMRWQF